MNSSKHEQTTRSDFAERYAIRSAVAMIDEIERKVMGEAWGNNGFTTPAEADELGARLALRADSRLLDLGCGCGWPGLYLSRETGCEVVLADMPIESLEIASRRAKAEKINALGAVAASARHLPFAHNSFTAIVHTDVVC
jgi:methylase of polypeptide subunit release factors